MNFNILLIMMLWVIIYCAGGMFLMPYNVAYKHSAYL